MQAAALLNHALVTVSRPPANWIMPPLQEMFALRGCTYRLRWHHFVDAVRSGQLPIHEHYMPNDRVAGARRQMRHAQLRGHIYFRAGVV